MLLDTKEYINFLLHLVTQIKVHRQKSKLFIQGAYCKVLHLKKNTCLKCNTGLKFGTAFDNSAYFLYKHFFRNTNEVLL